MIAVVGLTLGPLLVACGGGETVQEALGYERKGPDEMAVIKRPPLILPPDYNLRPPSPGEGAVAGSAASEAARRALIGSAAETDAPSAASAADGTRALLTGGASDNGTATDTTSEGQSLLVSRADRTERDLDKLEETRAENRVDGALLRRLLAWTSEDQTNADGEPSAVVQVVGRSRTVIDPEASAE